MKTIINFSLIYLLFFIPTFDGIGGGLFSQNPILYDHTWYLEKVIVDNDEFYLSNYTNYIATTTFNENANRIVVYLCDFDHIQAITNFSGNGFILSQLAISPFFGECDQYDANFFTIRNAYFSVYMDEFETPNNPFTYTLQAIDDYHQLTIENGNGDWAVYTSKLLSNTSFNKTGFTIYPNPVNEILHINNTFNHVVQASVYDVNGKLLHIQKIDNNNATINVKSLNQGLYFVVLENEMGEKISKKLIKR